MHLGVDGGLRDNKIINIDILRKIMVPSSIVAM